MKQTKEMNPVVISEEDYHLLKPFADRMPIQDEMSLAHEIGRAVVVKKDALPPHAVRLGSKVLVTDLDSGRNMEFTIVLPSQANIRNNRISVLTPMGTALIGFRKGEIVEWRVPAGLKRFQILEVVNS